MTKKTLKLKIIAARIFPSDEVLAIVSEELEKLADPKMIRQAVAKLDAMTPAQLAVLKKKGATPESGKSNETKAVA